MGSPIQTTKFYGADVPTPAAYIGWSEQEFAPSVPARFEQIVKTYGDQLALKDGQASMTYAQLNQQANQVAHAIIDYLGAGEEPIGLLMEHGSRLLVAMLAVLKAGKFYVPLDPAYPEMRLKGMVADAGCRLVITNHANAEYGRTVLDNTQIQVLNLEALSHDLPMTNLELPLGPETIFNLIYTSGSTGKPKGTLQVHGNVVFDTRASTSLLKLSPDDRFALIVPVTFGASVSDIFGAWLNGAALLLFDIKQDGLTQMAAWTQEEAITVTHTVPTIFRQWMSLIPDTELYPAMRVIKLGGEPLLQHDFQLFQKHFSDNCILRNALGTTETYMVTCYLMHPNSDVPQVLLPVGYPVEGRQIMILGEDGDPLPVGESGQVAVQSRYLSPGYWQQPILTEQAYSQAPTDLNARIYLTGDLGSVDASGCLTHLGRIDDMVKIRGQQVDLAAIEMALLDIPAVRETAIVAQKDVTGLNNRLVAYIVPATNPPPTIRAIRDALAIVLPDHMIPTSYVMMEKFPLLPFGKVNRRALPPPETGRPDLGVALEPPYTPNQEILAKIFSEALMIDEVGIHDHFFELGGDSLKATQLTARIRAEFQVELPVAKLFETPTIAQLAEYIVSTQIHSLEGGALEDLLTELDDLTDEEAQHLLEKE